MTTLILVLVILLVALMIPLTAVILDSQVGRALAARLERKAEIPSGVAERLAALESEVTQLGQAVEQLRDQSEFLHRLLEDRTEPQELLPPGDAKQG